MSSGCFPERHRGPTTKQGAAVLRLARSSQRFRSAQDMHAALRAAGEAVGLTTVYRHLQSLADDGVLDTLRTRSGELLYRCCRSEEHHHHLVCESCGRTVEIEAGDMEGWVERAAATHGYASTSHTLEIFGLCAACQKKAAAQDP
jgi:Fur family transcriptional regulator, ferric uptake regulator